MTTTSIVTEVHWAGEQWGGPNEQQSRMSGRTQQSARYPTQGPFMAGWTDRRMPVGERTVPVHHSVYVTTSQQSGPSRTNFLPSLVAPPPQPRFSSQTGSGYSHPFLHTQSDDGDSDDDNGDGDDSYTSLLGARVSSEELLRAPLMRSIPLPPPGAQPTWKQALPLKSILKVRQPPESGRLSHVREDGLEPMSPHFLSLPLPLPAPKPIARGTSNIRHLLAFGQQAQVPTTPRPTSYPYQAPIPPGTPLAAASQEQAQQSPHWPNVVHPQSHGPSPRPIEHDSGPAHADRPEEYDGPPKRGAERSPPPLSMGASPTISPVSRSASMTSPQMVDYTRAFYAGLTHMSSSPSFSLRSRPSTMSPSGMVPSPGMSVGMMSPPGMTSPTTGAGMMSYRGYQEILVF